MMEAGIQNTKNVIVIVGPTCSGKSNLAIKLAHHFNSEIISVDSRQFYNLLNIGTAKPSEKELKKVKHHFINILNPDEEYNASRFEIDAEKIITSLINKNKIPIVAGGSGLYIKSLIDGIVDAADRDNSYREKMNQQRKEFGNEYLYKKLEKVDPESAKKMLPQNWKRVMRALEVFHLTGEPIWKHHQKQKEKSHFNFYQYGLLWERELLYQNINRRVDEMINKGLVSEVENILKSGYNKNLNSLNTVGYKEIIQYLKGEITLERAIELIKRNTRRYAKRQITWFKKDERIEWFNIISNDELQRIEQNIIQKFS